MYNNRLVKGVSLSVSNFKKEIGNYYEVTSSDKDEEKFIGILKEVTWSFPSFCLEFYNLETSSLNVIYYLKIKKLKKLGQKEIIRLRLIKNI